MKDTWQLQEAKGQFCAVAEKAAGGGPQLVTKHGRPFVFIVGAKTWQKSRKRSKSLLEVLQSCPEDLTKLVTRDRDYPRDIEL